MAKCCENLENAIDFNNKFFINLKYKMLRAMAFSCISKQRFLFHFVKFEHDILKLEIFF